MSPALLMECVSNKRTWDVAFNHHHEEGGGDNNSMYEGDDQGVSSSSGNGVDRYRSIEGTDAGSDDECLMGVAAVDLALTHLRPELFMEMMCAMTNWMTVSAHVNR